MIVRFAEAMYVGNPLQNRESQGAHRMIIRFAEAMYVDNPP